MNNDQKVNQKKNIILGFCFCLLYILAVSYFLYMNLSNSDKSQEQSSVVTDTVIDVITTFDEDWNYQYDNVHSVVRKLFGHYGYSLMMGVLGFLTLYFFKIRLKNIFIINLILGLFISSIAELFQMIPEGRGPSYVDVLINYSGYISGLLLIFLIIKISIYIVNKKRVEYAR